jgi:hypothetical protein
MPPLPAMSIGTYDSDTQSAAVRGEAAVHSIAQARGCSLEPSRRAQGDCRHDRASVASMIASPSCRGRRVVRLIGAPSLARVPKALRRGLSRSFHAVSLSLLRAIGSLIWCLKIPVNSFRIPDPIPCSDEHDASAAVGQARAMIGIFPCQYRRAVHEVRILSADRREQRGRRRGAASCN